MGTNTYFILPVLTIVPVLVKNYFRIKDKHSAVKVGSNKENIVSCITSYFF